jgi:hypothetical protein
MKDEHEDARELHGITDAHCIESARIEFLLQRDGAEATLIWVQRTLVIYRRALLNRKHFAHSSEYRRKFVASCLSFRSWLALAEKKNGALSRYRNIAISQYRH